MTLATDAALEPLPATLPPVERRARIPAGFRAAGATAGIKASGRPDLVLIVADDGPVPAAAVFTPNRFAAAPVRLSRAQPPGDGRRRGGRRVRAGRDLDLRQRERGDRTRRRRGPGADRDGGRGRGRRARGPGAPPLDRDHRHPAAGRPGDGRRSPGSSPAAWRRPTRRSAQAAEALRTTDTTTKAATTTVTLPAAGGGTVEVTVTGICKGVGMMHPNMATMLSIVLTDATADPATLHALLRGAAARTWDQLSVDGDTSTNDTVFVLASGRAGAVAAGERRRRATGPRGGDRGGRTRPGAAAGGRRRGRQGPDHLPGDAGRPTTPPPGRWPAP